ncbi:MAG: GNAT family N-acetyltransferase [Chitinophagaceae bacterium]|nr:MAG: putative methicillin resistance protein [Bacteroidetes bacterium OLB11]MCC6447565.1 GNAT family N-acetyltransferase [Chitinophagaceae bacterium]HMN32877.1 GNAT family N-acetyltransferase [Chitinophagaceae bacterium]
MKYEQFCETCDVPLFFQPFWLNDLLENWDVLYAEHKGHFVFFIYQIEKKFHFKFLRSPHLCPYSGFLFSSSFLNHTTQQILIQQVLEMMPEFDEINLDLHPRIPLDIDFGNIGSRLKMTNILNLNNLETIEKNYKPALKRQIKKAQKTIHIQTLNDINLFYQLHEKTFLKQNSLPKIPIQTFQKAWEVCVKNNCGQLFFAVDENRNIHAAHFLVYDNETAYYLAGGTDAAYYGSGAMSLLMHHAIVFSAENKKQFFDFEGSMIPSVNRFFKNFSPDEIKYVNLFKENSALLKFLKSWKSNA